MTLRVIGTGLGRTGTYSLKMALNELDLGIFASASPEELTQAFEAHTRAVEAAIPRDQLLTFSVRDGWAPLCAFLGVNVPAAPFPRTNHREEFWEKVNVAG